MKNNKSKPDAHLKHRIGILPFLCLFFGLTVLILSIVYSIVFYLYLNSGGLNVSTGTIWVILSFLVPVLFLITSILIVVSLILVIFKKSRIPRLIVTFIGLLLNISGYTIGKYSHSTLERVDTVDERYYVYNQIYLRALKWVKQTIQSYAQKNDGQLPPAEKWCDVLVEFDPNISDDLTRHSISRLKESSRYALNSNLIGIRLDDIPKDAVLFFETKPDKNPVGGRESITAEHHYGKGCVVLFGDLHLEFVRTKDFNDLRWKP